MIKSMKNLTLFERCLWGGSVLALILVFSMGTNRDWWTLAASLIGVTALIFVAKGDVIGQILTIVFSLFYFVLKASATPNLVFSTISIATSFSASTLTMLRSPYYAIAYAANDVVLIVLWVLATLSDASFLPMVLCFVIFLVNDLYGFRNWRAMHRRQQTID